MATHRSSALTFVYKYLFPILWIAGFGIFMATTWSSAHEDARQWARGMLVLFPVAAFWLLWFVVRLRRVDATPDGLVIRSRFGDATIPYEHVDWVYEIAMMNPPLISLKYTDPRRMESKKIHILPPMETAGLTLFGERPMTQFIRQMVMEAKPSYTRKQEPNRWLPMVVTFVTSIPVILVFVYVFGFPFPGLK